MNKQIRDNLVSVVIPCYNSEATITACLESVTGQNYRDFEILVVDDGSTDRTIHMIEDFIERTSAAEKIKLYRSANFGPSTARNNAIRQASGEFIAFLDSDDIWLLNKLEKQIKLFKAHPQLTMIGASHPHSRHIKDASGWVPITLKKLLYKNYFQTSSVILRSSALPSEPFRTNQKYSEDYDLWLRLATTGALALITVPLTVAERSPYLGKGLSSRLWQMERGELGNFTRLYHRKDISSKDLLFACGLSISKFFYRMFKTIS